MARKQYITRTVAFTEGSVVFAQKDGKGFQTIPYVLQGEYDDAGFLKEVTKRKDTYDNAKLVPVSVSDVIQKNEWLSMPLELFIELASPVKVPGQSEKKKDNGGAE